jgi:hypothetical protein
MKNSWIASWVLVTLLAVGLTWSITTRSAPARAEPEGAAAAGARYTVVETEGHNLIVTDNQTQTLYFYTIDKDAKIGSDLKLRGKIDLKQVGKEVVKPSDVKLRK